MPKKLIIGTEEFEFPFEGENAGYGEEVTDWADAVTRSLSTVQQRNDIPISSASILNNIITPTAIPGFSFNTSEVISINGEFIVRRTTDSPATNLVENGSIEGNFDGSNWNISIISLGNSGVQFDITASGQVTYTSSNITGTNYAGEVIFKAKVFNQT